MLTGRPVTEEMHHKIVEFIKQKLDEMIEAIDHNKVKDGKYEHNLADAYGTIVDAVSNIDYHHIEEMHKELYAAGADDLKLYIFHQCLFYAGTIDSVRFVVDTLKDKNFNDFYHMRDEFYDSMDVAVMFPHSINKIMVSDAFHILL